MFPDEVILHIISGLESEKAYLVIVVLVTVGVLKLIEKLISGWISNRSKIADYYRETDKESRRYERDTIASLQDEIDELRGTQIVELKSEIKILKDRLDDAEKESETWRNRYYLVVTQAEQQRNIITALEAQADQQQVTISDLLAKVSHLQAEIDDMRWHSVQATD